MLAEIRGYKDKIVEINGVKKTIRKEKQCLDEDMYAIV